MSALDPEILAERTAAVDRHLARVAQLLPATAAELRPMTEAGDGIILHLWQATQIAIDLAMSACMRLRLATPATYADAFRALGQAGIVERVLAERLVRAAGFRNVIAHAYGRLDMARVWEAARTGPADLRELLGALARA